MRWTEYLSHPLVAGIGLLATVWSIPSLLDNTSTWSRWATLNPQWAGFFFGAGGVLLVLFIIATIEKRWRKNREELLHVIREQQKRQGREMSEKDIALVESQLPGPWDEIWIFLDTAKYLVLLIFLLPPVVLLLFLLLDKSVTFWAWLFGVG